MSRFVLLRPSVGPLTISPNSRSWPCQHQAVAQGAKPSAAVPSVGAGFSTATAV